MRLKLNKTLRAALIAAISVVGFTLPQALADQVTVQHSNMLTTANTTWTKTNGNFNTTEGSYTSNNGGWNKGTAAYNFEANDKTAITLSGQSDRLTFSYDLSVSANAYVTLTMLSSNGCTLTTGWGEADGGTTDRVYPGKQIGYAKSDNTSTTSVYQFKDSTSSPIVQVTEIDTFPTTGYGTYSISGTIAWDAASSGYLLTLTSTPSGQAAETKTLTLGSNPLTFTDIVITAEGKNGASYKISNIGIDASFTVSESLVWKGTPEHSDWNDPVWGNTGDQPFVSGTDVLFNDAATSKEVTVSQNVTAGTVTVADAYEFQLTGGNLTASKIAVTGDGASLSITGNHEVSAQTILLDTGKKLTVSEGAVVSLSSITAGTGDYVEIASDATGKIAGASANALEHVSGSGDIHIAGNTLFAGSSNQEAPATTHSTGTLFVDEGKTLSIGTTNTGGYEHTYVNMESFEKIQLDNSNLYIHNDEFTLKNLTVTAKGGKVTIHDTTGQNDNTLTLAGTTKLDGNLTFVGTWKQKFTINALDGEGSLILNGADHDKQIVNIGGGSVGKLQIGKSNVEANITGDLTVGGLTGTEGTVNVSVGKKLTFNVAQDAAYTYSSTLNGANLIAKSGLGTQTISALEVTTGSLEATDGILVLGDLTKTGEGEYSMSGTGTVKLGSSIALQGGALTMSGTYDINDLEVEGGTPTFEGGDNYGNGFATENGTIQVVTIAGESGATIDADSGTFVWNNTSRTMDSETGKVAVSGTKYDVFYVNTLSEKVSKAMEHGQELASIRVMDGATLTVDQDINASLINAASAGKVSINAGQVVTADVQDRAVSLTGAGTYRLAENVASLGSATLGEGWTGAVEVTGASLGGRDFTFNALANENSSVLMSNVAIWWNPDVVGQSANIRLNDAWKDNGTATGNTAALQIKDASAGRTYTFSGAISGAGDMAFTKTGTLALTVRFTGDLSGWTGKYASYIGDAGTRSALQFYTAGESTVNAGIDNHGGLNVTFGGNDTTHITMNGAIANNEGQILNLTIAKDTDFTQSVEVTSVTVNAGATATFAAGLPASIITLGQNAGLNMTGEAMSIADLTIGAGSTVAVYTDTQAATEGTVTISDTLTAGGATLLANLTIVGNEQGTTTWELGGAAMTLGSKLTLDTTTSLINLDAATIAALEDLSVGGRLDFITAAQDSTLTYGGEGYEGMWYDGLFVRTEGVHGDYRVYASETSFGLTKVSNVPEPTTGTLSLLALMALAARRRKH